MTSQATEHAVLFWAEWARAQREGLGWYKSSVFARIAELAGYAPTSSGGRSNPVLKTCMLEEYALSIERALSMLDDTDRALLLLRIAGGQTYTDIARETGIPRYRASEAYRTALHRLTKRLSA